MIASMKITEDYWTGFNVEQSDIEFIYNLLLEKATPIKSEELLKALVTYRIAEEADKLQESANSRGAIYLPKTITTKGTVWYFRHSRCKKGK